MSHGVLGVYLQALGAALHPISQAVLTTAVSLAQEKNCAAVGFLCTSQVSPALLQALKFSGLSKCFLLEDARFSVFSPQEEAVHLKACFGEDAEILLFPATPEGRALSATAAAKYATGVTADCTALSFTKDGLLLQTRPAFSGNLLAHIVTKNARPQMASLRFASAIEPAKTPCNIQIVHPKAPPLSLYTAKVIEEAVAAPSNQEVVLAIGGGVQSKEELTLYETLATALHATLLSSRALVDRGWMPKSKQIGLSGQSISARFLLTLGISGSLQFCAGLQNIGTLCSVDVSPDAPMLKLADIPIVADMQAVAKAILDRKKPFI